LDKKRVVDTIEAGLLHFPEYLNKPDFSLYFANRIYKPSYVSLHTALAFYGMIPEAVVQITSVTSLKTANFKNPFGEFSYKSVRADFMYGYNIRPIADGRTLQLAKPEKALLDLLYLYPFYNTSNELEGLRLDEDFMQDEFDWELMQTYTLQFKNKTLEKRVNLLINRYKL